MKKLTITVIIFITVIFTSIFTLLYSNRKFKDVLTGLNEVNLSIDENSWQKASTQLEFLQKKFEHDQKKLQTCSNRNSLEKIESELNKLKAATIFKNKFEATTQIMKLKNKIKSTMEEQEPLLQNIL